MDARAAIAFSVLAMVLSPRASAKDFVLTIGGGYAPSGNQVSLEKNVQFFTDVLQRTHSGDYQHTIFFADGHDPARDVQYLTPHTDSAEAEELLALVFHEHDHFFERYRNHQLPRESEAATGRNISAWFAEVGSQIGADDRLLIYVTAHGGKSRDERDPYNTVLHLWSKDDLTMRELSGKLNELPPEVPVVIVMVQCYSGGFSRLLFNGGDPQRGMVSRSICGFFATTHDRVAAGCTPQINEADYHEYSSGFWAAISGRTRTGKPLERPDYNNDGKTSFAEAHAYVVIHSDTIDRPVKTSDTFLRVFSELQPDELPLVSNESEGQTTTARPVAPLTVGTPIDELLAAAGPADRAVIQGLSERLNLDGTDRAIAAGRLDEAIDDQRDSLRRQRRRQERQANWLRERIEGDVLRQWPELAGDWNPAGRRFVRKKPREIIELIKSHKQYKRWQEARSKRDALDDQLTNLECKAVKCQRLIYRIESVVLAHNLPLVASDEIVGEYLALRAAEQGTLD